MSATKNDILETIPFDIEKEGNYIQISEKARGHLTSQQRKEFDGRKTIVKMELWTAEQADRINKIPIPNFSKDSYQGVFSTLLDRISKVTKMLF
jgi:hypothetical protein